MIESKQKTWKELGDKLERDSRENQKLFYRVLQNLRNKRGVNTAAIKIKQGEILKNENEIMNKWK